MDEDNRSALEQEGGVCVSVEREALHENTRMRVTDGYSCIYCTSTHFVFSNKLT